MRIFLILISILSFTNIYSQDFGCFEVSEFPSYSSYLFSNGKPLSNYDSIFWLQYKLDKHADGYCKIQKNQYQTKMEGNIINGKREGIWKFYENDGDYRRGYERIYIVNFVNNKKEGNYKLIRTNYKDTSIILTGSYINDFMEGEFLTFTLNDTTISSISHYKEGKKDGVFVDYDFTKNKMKYVSKIKYFKNGLNNGNEFVFKNRQNNILLERIYTFSNDTLIDEIVFTKNNDINWQVYDKFNKNEVLDIKKEKNGNKDTFLIIQKKTTNWIEHKNDKGNKEYEGKGVKFEGKSFRDSIWTYYYNTGELKALINYKEGLKIGESKYFDKTGKLKRVEIINSDGSCFNIYEGDTVNYLDNKGSKQGKWISLPYHSDLNDNGCNDLPEGIRYYKDNKAVGKWEIKSERFYREYSKSVYIWKDSTLAYCYYYSKNNNNIIEEGDIIDMTLKFGKWKEYDSKKGYIKAEGEYYLNRKIGKWTYYKRNGKIKNTKEF